MNAIMFKLLLIAALLSSAFGLNCYLQMDKQNSKGTRWMRDCTKDDDQHCITFKIEHGVFRTCGYDYCTDPELMKAALKEWNASSADCCKGDLCNHN